MKISKVLQSNSVTFCDIECPQCSRVAKLLDYFVDNQEEINCPQCGYNSITDKETNETKIEYGYGVLYIEFYNKPFIYYIFDTPPTDKDIKDYLEMFNDKLIIKEKSYLYLYDINTGKFNVLKGSRPRFFDEYIEEKIEETKYSKYPSVFKDTNPFN